MSLHTHHTWLLIFTWLAIHGSVACTERVPTAPTPSPTSSPVPSPTPSCTYQLTGTSRSHTSGAERGGVGVTAPSGCAWTVTSGVSWITVISGSSGVGTGGANYAVEANNGPSRTGQLIVAGQTVTVNQGTPSPTPYDGQWTGSGRGESSGPTAALVEMTLLVTDGIIGNLNLSWRIDTAPGAPSLFCSGMTAPIFIRISVGAISISWSSFPPAYRFTISGVFSSTNSVSGTLQIVPMEGAQPWCLGATVSWSATKQ